MKKDRWLATAAVAGIILVVLYVMTCAVDKRREPQLAEAITVFLSSCGAVGGLRLCHRGLSSSTPLEQKEEWVYEIVGGIAVIWISMAAFYAAFVG
jgi:hypothetical protein